MRQAPRLDEKVTEFAPKQYTPSQTALVVNSAALKLAEFSEFSTRGCCTFEILYPIDGT
jgi:hypothetical protein